MRAFDWPGFAEGLGYGAAIGAVALLLAFGWGAAEWVIKRCKRQRIDPPEFPANWEPPSAALSVPAKELHSPGADALTESTVAMLEGCGITVQAWQREALRAHFSITPSPRP